MDQAARRYFRKPARNLTLAEAAMIAGLLKAPSRYSPLSNATLARTRARLVLSQMQEAGFISEDEERKAADEISHALRAVPSALSPPVRTTPIDYVMDQLGPAYGRRRRGRRRRAHRRDDARRRLAGQRRCHHRAGDRRARRRAERQRGRRRGARPRRGASGARRRPLVRRDAVQPPP
ncbi:MAG: transglycosylase domain-containing protein [Hyphomicrobium sp.]